VPVTFVKASWQLVSSCQSGRSLFNNREVVIGAVPTGGYKVCVRGFKVLKTGLSKDPHWVEAGRQARSNNDVISSFRRQELLGYPTREAAAVMAAALFRTEARFNEFVSIALGSASIKHSTAPTFHCEPFIPWPRA